jgi:hypothetical protein
MTLVCKTVINVRSANVTVLMMIRRRCPNRSDSGDRTEGSLTVLDQEFDCHDENGKGAKNH